MAKSVKPMETMDRFDVRFVPDVPEEPKAGTAKAPAPGDPLDKRVHGAIVKVTDKR